MSIYNGLNCPKHFESQSKVKLNRVDELINKTRFRITDPLQETPVCIELVQNGFAHKIGTLGNILLIQAKGKAGKTYFTSALTSSLISDKEYINFRGNLPIDKPKVIYFDTEQGHEDARTVQQRIYDMAGLDNDQEAPNFEYYCLRSLLAPDRLLVIEYIINSRIDIGAVIIDGVRDLIYDFNNTEQSFTLIEKLMKWTGEKLIHIIAILHQNPNDDKAKGHLGTELTNKAEYIISINRDKGDDSYRTVEGYGRRKSFRPFDFTLDKDEFPILKEGERLAAKLNPLNLDTDIHKNLLLTAFDKLGKDKKITKNALWQSVKLNFKLFDYKYSFSDSQCRELVDFYIQQNFIKNIGTHEKYDLKLNLK